MIDATAANAVIVAAEAVADGVAVDAAAAAEAEVPANPAMLECRVAAI